MDEVFNGVKGKHYIIIMHTLRAQRGPGRHYILHEESKKELCNHLQGITSVQQQDLG